MPEFSWWGLFLCVSTVARCMIIHLLTSVSLAGQMAPQVSCQRRCGACTAIFPHILSSPGVNPTNTATAHAATCEGKSLPLPLLIFLSFTLSHWAWRAPWFTSYAATGADLSVRKKEGSSLWVTSEKCRSAWGGVRDGVRETEVKEGRWGARQESLSERGKMGGGRENSLHSQKPLKFDSPTLWINQPIIPLSLSFKFVSPSTGCPPPPCLWRSPSLWHSLGRIVNFDKVFLTWKTVVHLVSPSIFCTCSVFVCVGKRKRESSYGFLRGVWYHSCGNNTLLQVMPSTSPGFHLALCKFLCAFFFSLPSVSQYAPSFPLICFPPSPFLWPRLEFFLIELYSRSNLLKSVLAVTSPIEVVWREAFRKGCIKGKWWRKVVLTESLLSCQYFLYALQHMNKTVLGLVVWCIQLIAIEIIWKLDSVLANQIVKGLCVVLAVPFSSLQLGLQSCVTAGVTWQPQLAPPKLIKVTNRCLSSNFQPVLVTSQLHVQVVFSVILRRLLQSSAASLPCSQRAPRLVDASLAHFVIWLFLMCCLKYQLRSGHIVESWATQQFVLENFPIVVFHVEPTLKSGVLGQQPSHLLSSAPFSSFWSPPSAPSPTLVLWCIIPMDPAYRKSWRHKEREGNLNIIYCRSRGEAIGS